MPRTSNAEQPSSKTNDTAEQSVLSAFSSEDYVIGCLVKDYTFASNLCESIRFSEDYFESPTARSVWHACEMLESAGKPVDPASVIVEISKKDPHTNKDRVSLYVERAMKIALDPHDLMFHIKNVRDAYSRRKAISITKSAMAELHDEHDIDDVVTKMEHGLRAISSSGVADNKSPKDIVAKIKQRYLGRRKNGKAGIESRWGLIQNMIGGYRFGKLTVIGARPKMGKSTLALNEALFTAYANQIPSAFFSIEMDRDELLEKAASDITKMDNFKLQLGGYSEKEIKRFVNEGIEPVVNSELHIIDNPSMTVEYICTKIRRLVAEHDIKLVVIDYLQIISSTPGSKFQSKTYEIAHWLGQLRIVAKETKVALILLSQISRASKDARKDAMPTMSDLRDSGSIEQDAYVVMLIGATQSHGDEPSWMGCQPVCLRVDANRGGRTGDVEMVFGKPINRFMSWSEYTLYKQDEHQKRVKNNAKKTSP